MIASKSWNYCIHRTSEQDQGEAPMPNTAPSRSFPLNAWYAAVWDAELGRALFPRTICNKKMVLYRRQDGRAVALEDACWHRLLPLSKGKLRRRRGGVRLSRPRLRSAWPLHLHAVAGDHQSVGLRALLPGDREASLRLGVAGRSRARRSGARCRTCTGTTTRNGTATARPSTSSATIAWCSTI